MEYCLGIEVPPEQYMETGRKFLFLIFAVVSWVYKWVVTLVILRFTVSFLKPYKLEIISYMLTALSLGSMFGYPIYSLIKNTRKRGRLPDMKPARVTLSACAVAVLLLIVFLVPMPVTRIRQPGVVQVQPDDIRQVHIQAPGRLQELKVKEGQRVKEGAPLAIFTSVELDNRKNELSSQIGIKQELVHLYKRQLNRETDHREQARLQDQLQRAESDLRQANAKLEQVNKEMKHLVLRAPHDGVVMGLPQIDEIGKYWEREQTQPFCSVGEKNRLRVLIAVTPSDYDLIKENLDKLGWHKTLAATIRVQGRDSKTWKGHIAQLPKAEAREIPPALSTRGGGPVAVRPPAQGQQQQQLVPQAQVFLVGIDFEDSDSAIAIGSMAQVKIHCEFRSCAWWLWRTVNSIFDLML
jgi:putative peptide zinc metalloprotease protein